MAEVLVTILYYDENSAELKTYTGTFPRLGNHRVLINEAFKAKRSIIAVCEGRVNVLNKLGDRASNDLDFLSNYAAQACQISE